MDHHHHQKKCKVVGHQTSDDDDDEDRISNLPESVIEAILKYLTTRDVVRTSVLGQKWRYRWAKLPQLILDYSAIDVKSFVSDKKRVTLPMILYQYLLLHEGPILKFSLRVPTPTSSKTGSHDEVVNKLMLFLSRKGVEDLTLKSGAFPLCRLRQSVSKCHQLRHLCLEYCSIETMIPPDFKGFGRLVSLKLLGVSVSERVLATLIHTSPLLELLELSYLQCGTGSPTPKIVVDAPKLKSFMFRGLVSSVIFRTASVLRSVFINPFKLDDHNVDRFFSSLPALENLSLCRLCDVGRYSVASGVVPEKLQTALVRLKTLKISDWDLNSSTEVQVVLCMLRSSPNLKGLEVHLGYGMGAVSPHGLVMSLGDQEYSDIKLGQLKVVKLQYHKGTSVVLEFIKFILVKSPVLEKMFIRGPWGRSDTDQLELLVQLSKFRRASNEAEVIYEA